MKQYQYSARNFLHNIILNYHPTGEHREVVMLLFTKVNDANIYMQIKESISKRFSLKNNNNKRNRSHYFPWRRGDFVFRASQSNKWEKFCIF